MSLEEIVKRAGEFQMMVSEVALVVVEPGGAGKHLSRGPNTAGSQP